MRKEQQKMEEQNDDVVSLPDVQNEEIQEDTIDGNQAQDNGMQNNNVIEDDKNTGISSLGDVHYATENIQNASMDHNNKMDHLVKELDELKRRYHVEESAVVADEPETNSNHEMELENDTEKSGNKLHEVMEKIARLQKDAALAVESKIEALPAIGALTLNDKDAVDEVKASFDMLTSEVRELISEKNVNKLHEAVSKIAELQGDAEAAAAVEKAIDSLNHLAQITLADKDAVNEAKALYDALTSSQKRLISQPKVTKLEAAVSKMNRLLEAVEIAAMVEEAMDQIPSPEDITLEDKPAIDKVKEMFEKLDKTKRDFIPRGKIISFTAAVKKAEQLQADTDMALKVESDIRKLPSAGNITLAFKETVNKVKADFDSLNKTQREMISSDLINKLNEAVNIIIKLQENAYAAESFAYRVNSLPDMDQLDLSSKSIIEELTAIYKDMDDQIKILVDSATLQKLYNAEKKIRAIQDDFNMAGEVEKEIDEIVALKEIDINYQEKIIHVKNNYDSLTEMQKSFIPKSKIIKFHFVVDKLSKLQHEYNTAKEFESLIYQLPELEQITLEHKEKISNLMMQWNNFKEEQKGMVDSESILFLENAHKKILELQTEADRLATLKKMEKQTEEEAAVALEEHKPIVEQKEEIELQEFDQVKDGKFSVLIVDDASFMRTILRKIIEEIDGFVVCGEAVNGHQAIEQVKKLKPDIITMDITMPDMDGIVVVKEVLQIQPKAKIIMCTAVNQKNMIIQAIKNGAKDFITKPFDKTQVQEALKNVATL